MGKNFPEHWVEVPFSETLISLESGSRPRGGVKGINDGIPSIGAEHLNSEGGFNFTNLRFVPIEFAKKMKRGKIEVYDILIVKDGATTGKVSIVKEDFPYKFACVNEHVFICRLTKNIYVNFCFFFLRSHNGQDQIMSSFHGGAQGGINSEFIHAISIPLPPLNEQKRIVEKLDAILPKVKSAKARLEKIPVILKKFRQSVLAAACSGKLTEDWREEYTQRTGKELPEWDEKKLNEIAQINPKNKIDDELEVSFIPMAFISSMFNKNPEFEVKNWKEIKKGFNHFKDNDVIVAKITPCFENSKAGIVRNLKNGYGAGTTEIYVLRCYDFILPEYLYYIIKTNDFIESGKSLMTGTAGQQRIPRYFIENFEINLPPLEEQQEIVRRVEKLFALADSLEAKYKKALERVEKLEQAILAKAFRGELVEPDPNDEPAEELLKRILEEKAKIEGGKKTRKPRTRKK